jgi:two-component system, NtrC family, sensor kinase
MEKISRSWPDSKGNNSQSNTPGDFDREYALDELLSISVVEELCNEIQKVAPISIALFMKDATLFFAKGSFKSDDIDSFYSIINQEGIDSPKTFDSSQGQITISPITHQLETIGYMVVGNEPNRDRPTNAAVFLSGFLLKTFSHLIVHKYRYELTAGLHEQVVKESYDRLKEKAVLLENSERRYRQLAKSLEIEVQQKTQEIKEAQTQLMQQEKMASIGQLAAGVAHEINNPMGFVSSNLNTLKKYDRNIRSLIEQYRSFFSGLKDGAAEEKDRTNILEGIKHITKFEKETDIEFVLQDLPNLIKESLDGADRIRKIVVDLKDFAHPGEEALKFAGINENLDSTLNVVWNELKYKANVTKDYGELPLVKCYPRQLNQVFMNILVNAAQAIDEKGEIKITTRSEGEQVRITISDTGSGIPKENLSKIFDPFFTTKEVGKGTGLGLNVAYNVIKKHNGMIDVESTLDKGTTFTIHLPSNS